METACRERNSRIIVLGGEGFVSRGIRNTSVELPYRHRLGLTMTSMKTSVILAFLALLGSLAAIAPLEPNPSAHLFYQPEANSRGDST